MANFNIDYLVVAGGAGGGIAGGGAGGYRTSFGTGNINGGLTALENPLNLSPSITYTVIVGVGGVGANHNTRVPGYSGGNSAISGANITTITSTGGGGGGTAGASGTWTAGVDGGSGGGSHDNSSAGAAVTNPVQGFAGGVQGVSAGGGGGGAGSVGNSNTDGGLGLASTITGSSLQYAGGGGGYPSGGGTFGGGTATTGTGTSGTANTGGGGGAGLTPGSGGSGVVILRYATADVVGYAVTGAAPTEDTTTVAGQTILSFTTVGTGSITFTAPTPPPTPTFDGTKVTTPVTGFQSAVDIGLKIPIGTNSNLPTGVEGMIRNDTEEVSGGTNSTTAITFYNGTDWKYFTSTESPDVVYPTSLKMYLNASDTASYPGTGTTWFDLTANNNDGTISGAAWNPGGYFDFDGTNDYVSIPSTATEPFQASARAFTLSMWINRDSTGADPLMTKYGANAATRSWYFSINASGQLEMGWWNGSSLVYKTAASAIVNTTSVWYYVVLAVSPTLMNFYTQGVLRNYVGGSVTHSAGGNESIIIASQAGGNYNFFNGQISKVRIYDATLTQAEITALYAEGP